jgi:hypothetical protein
MKLDRRAILELGLVAVAASLTGCRNKEKQAQVDGVLNTRQDLKSAAIVGELWLTTQKTPPSMEQLAATLSQGAPTNPKAMTRWLRERHQADLVEGRVTEASGWVLSETEARIYALAALS